MKIAQMTCHQDTRLRWIPGWAHQHLGTVSHPRDLAVNGSKDRRGLSPWPPTTDVQEPASDRGTILNTALDLAPDLENKFLPGYLVFYVSSFEFRWFFLFPGL